MGFLEVYKLICSVWGIYKKYHGCCFTEQEIDKITEQIGTLYEQYGKSKLAKDMLIAIICEFERIRRGRVDKNDS